MKKGAGKMQGDNKYFVAGAAIATAAYLILREIAESEGKTVSDLVRQAIFQQFPEVAEKATPIRPMGRPKGYSPKTKKISNIPAMVAEDGAA